MTDQTCSCIAAAERRSRQLTLVLAATVLAAVCLGALGWSWSAERERTRIERVESRIESVLREASGHAGSGDWTRALVTLEQGEVLAAGDEVSDALRAVDECGAPVVSIPGGEPLIHDEMPQIVNPDSGQAVAPSTET